VEKDLDLLMIRKNAKVATPNTIVMSVYHTIISQKLDALAARMVRSSTTITVMQIYNYQPVTRNFAPIMAKH
jgi:hypothetical protein